MIPVEPDASQSFVSLDAYSPPVPLHPGSAGFLLSQFSGVFPRRAVG
jgi:hypothetical protein